MPLPLRQSAGKLAGMTDQLRIHIKGGATTAGSFSIPGDKSISHRAAMLSAIADGRSILRSMAPGQDVASTRACMIALGSDIRQEFGADHFQVIGKSIDQLRASAQPLNCGNSGTTARLLAGLLTAIAGPHILVGDDSLSRRPMRRVIEPLSKLGASLTGTGSPPTMPLSVQGGQTISHGNIETPVASAQVKSAILLAGLFASGPVSVYETTATRDHTERMLQAMGASVATEPLGTGQSITVQPLAGARLQPLDIEIPGDPSTAAFMLALGLLTSDEGVRVRNVCVNPRRTGFLGALERMGATIELYGRSAADFEPTADLLARRSELSGIEIEPSEVPDLIDELPLLAVLASQATGETQIRGAGELRVKESDRISAVCQGLTKMGAEVTELPDGLRIRGPSKLFGAEVESHDDHRIAMALAVAAAAADGVTLIRGDDCIGVSDPMFWDRLNSAGVNVWRE